MQLAATRDLASDNAPPPGDFRSSPAWLGDVAGVVEIARYFPQLARWRPS